MIGIKRPISFTTRCKAGFIMTNKKEIRLILTLLEKIDLIKLKYPIGECIIRLNDYLDIKESESE